MSPSSSREPYHITLHFRRLRLVLRVSSLVQRIDGQAAEELGEEVSGFLRHYVAGECYFLQLLHGYGVGQEGDVCLAAAHLLHGLPGIAEVAEVGLLADLFGI